MPIEIEVKEHLQEILKSKLANIDKAIELSLYSMKTQVSMHGNKRRQLYLQTTF